MPMGQGPTEQAMPASSERLFQSNGRATRRRSKKGQAATALNCT